MAIDNDYWDEYYRFWDDFVAKWFQEREKGLETPKDKDFRRELLGQLGSLGAETALRMLKDGLIVAGIAD